MEKIALPAGVTVFRPKKYLQGMTIGVSASYSEHNEWLDMHRAFAFFSEMVFNTGGRVMHVYHPVLSGILIKRAERFWGKEEQPTPRPILLVLNEQGEESHHYHDRDKSYKDKDRQYAEIYVIPNQGEESQTSAEKSLSSECDGLILIGSIQKGTAHWREAIEATKQRIPCYVVGAKGDDVMALDKATGGEFSKCNRMDEAQLRKVAEKKDLELAVVDTYYRLIDLISPLVRRDFTPIPRLEKETVRKIALADWEKMDPIDRRMERIPEYQSDKPKGEVRF